MNKFYKNLILCGEVDYHCLLCEEAIQTDAEVERHIRWENHRKLMKDVTYLPKFRPDCIIKIGDQFYCESCNILLSTTIKTTLHVKDQTHFDKKQPSTAAPPSKIVREAKNIRILDRYIINENEWNGIIDKQCLLCEIDLDDVASHLRRPKHNVNLIKTRIEFLDGDKFFRKIGGDIFYCFICKSPHPTSNLDTHWTTEEHLNMKKKTGAIINNGAGTSKQTFNDEFKQNMKKMFKFSEKNNNTTTKNTMNANADILDKQKEFQKEGIEINFEKSMAVCRKCKFSPAFTVEAIAGHIKMHKKAETDSPGFKIPGEMSDDDDEWTTESDDSIGGDTIYSSDEDEMDEIVEENEVVVEEEVNVDKVWIPHLDHGKIRSELSKFGKENHIRLVNAGSKGYCVICDNYISAHIKNFKQHIKGAKHIAHLEANGVRTNNTNKENNPTKNPPPNNPEYTTKTLKKYLRNIFFVKHMDDFWINRKMCIDKHSFVLVSHVENNGKYDKMKCYLCNKTFPSDQDQKHCQEEEHKSKLFETKVITSIKREFIREVRPNLFHCGYCNEVFPSFDILRRRHLRNFKHVFRREQQELVADNTDDMYGMHMEDTQTAEHDLLWLQLMGNRLL